MKFSHGLAAITAFAFLSAASIPAGAEMVPIYGPVKISKTKDYSKEKDEGKEAKFDFTAPVAGNGVLIVKNGGDLGKKDRVSSAKIRLNERKIAGSHDFNKKVDELRFDVELKDKNKLEVKVKSCEECFIEVTVLGEPAPAVEPPAPPMPPAPFMMPSPTTTTTDTTVTAPTAPPPPLF